MATKESVKKTRKRIRSKVKGTSECPRLAIFRSNTNIYAQVIDDVSGNTLVSCSTLDQEVKAKIIDIRKGSNTYLKVYSIKLNQNENKIVYIPNGFAHGYMALEDNSQVIYLSSNYHSSKHERQINPLDPYFNLNYAHKPILSEKDEQAEFISYLP